MNIKVSVFFIFILVFLPFQALVANDFSLQGIESVTINTDASDKNTAFCASDLLCVVKSHILEIGIAGALSLIILFLILLSKKSKKQMPKNLESSTRQDSKMERKDQQNIPLRQEEKKVEKRISSPQVDDLEQTTKTQGRKKREVPYHDRIKKEDFSYFKGVRVLIAEDNIINQKVISGLLAGSGIEYVIANDGVEALEILQKDKNFNLVLMDVHMPRLNGFETTRKIREIKEYEHIAVIALSGDTATDDIKKMTQSGMEEYLEKPLRMDALYDVLYAYTDDPNQTSNLNTKELNIEDGLEICCGDKEFYDDILNDFINSYSDAPKRIETFLKNNRRKEIDILLLDIAGVAANIGANILHTTALEFKQSLQTSAITELQSKLENFTLHLNTLLQEITEYKQL